MKLFTVLSIWHKRIEGPERVRWLKIRSSSIEADDMKLLGGFESHPNDDVARIAEAFRKSFHRPQPREGV
ncbi:MAG: hypothetical protein AB9903_05150 [Vulcanimicrobiota bacterium]